MILDKLADAFDPQRPEALLIGGLALPAYGVVRQTLDVDCVAAADAAPKLHRVLIAAGYEEAGSSETVARYRHASPMLLDVDLMLVDRETYDKLLRDSRAWPPEQNRWRVPSLPHLAALKLHAIKNNPDRRGKDVGDIADLVRRHPKALARDEMRELCERFGPANIFEEIEKLNLWKS